MIPPDSASPQHDSTFQGFVQSWGPRVEAALQDILPNLDQAPERLHAAMRYAMFPGGKRLRPMLALIGSVVTGGDPERALRSAAGLELLHTYSLVHDDLPCMDDDELRRGRPTCHIVYGDAMAVLVGDALLTLAFEVVADGGADAVRELARAAGSIGMVGGQVADLESSGAPEDRAPAGREPVAGAEKGPTGTVRPEAERVEWIHDHKTAALIRASLVVGAYAGGGDRSTLAALASYGDLVGRAFQIADDCLDLTGTEQNLGKRPGQDLAADKLTYPAVMGLSASQELAGSLVAEAEQLASTICSWGADRLQSRERLLIDVARFTVARGS